MQDKEKVIVEIMGLVGVLEENVELLSQSSKYYAAVVASRDAIESKLRDLVNQTTVQEPLSDEKIDALWVFCGDLSIPQKVQRRMIVRTAEAAHGIIKGF